MAFIDKVLDRSEKYKRMGGLCKRCSPHGGCNGRKRQTKPDAYKNHRRAK